MAKSATLSSSSKKANKLSTLSSSSRVTKPSKKNNAKRPPPQEVKSKARTAPEQLKKKKKREYTEEELDLPKLNTITPVGLLKPKGKKKGKTFVDDSVSSFCFIKHILYIFMAQFYPGSSHFLRYLQEGMMTILAMVNAEQEGRIESKMMRARQLEEIREARRKEAEAREAQKKSKLVRES